MCLVDDKYIKGETVRGQRKCPICKQQTLCIKIHVVELPPGVTIRATILLDKEHSTPNKASRNDDEGAVRHELIGVGCGDYAKFHRQLVHITG